MRRSIHSLRRPRGIRWGISLPATRCNAPNWHETPQNRPGHPDGAGTYSAPSRHVRRCHRWRCLHVRTDTCLLYLELQSPPKSCSVGRGPSLFATRPNLPCRPGVRSYRPLFPSVLRCPIPAGPPPASAALRPAPNSSAAPISPVLPPPPLSRGSPACRDPSPRRGERNRARRCLLLRPAKPQAR